MNKDELVKLDCRTIHEIKTCDPSVKEEDILYHIFAVESGGFQRHQCFYEDMASSVSMDA